MGWMGPDGTFGSKTQGRSIEFGTRYAVMATLVFVFISVLSPCPAAESAAGYRESLGVDMHTLFIGLQGPGPAP